MIFSASTEPVEVTIIKLGGSLITNKAKENLVLHDRLDQLADVITGNIRAIPGRAIVIMGGGSVGHFAAKRLRVDRGVPGCDLPGLHDMPARMYALKSNLAARFGARGIPTLPFQETSYLWARACGTVAMNDAPLRYALHLGIVPILSGGLVFDEGRGVRPLNGDIIPLALDPTVFRIQRMVMLTDVPGVLDCNGEVIRHLDRATRARMGQLTADSGHIDVTGGMEAKVDVALALCERGIPSVICSGSELDDCRFRSIVRGTPQGCTLAGFEKC